MNMHYHGCPECYEKWPCEENCTIEYDLQDGDKAYGAYCVCDQCDVSKYKTKEFWDIYNGFKKRK